jgi:thiamine monophosphate synthase
MEKGAGNSNKLFVLTIIHHLALDIGAYMLHLSTTDMTMNMPVYTCAFHQTHMEHIY